MRASRNQIVAGMDHGAGRYYQIPYHITHAVGNSYACGSIVMAASISAHASTLQRAQPGSSRWTKHALAEGTGLRTPMSYVTYRVRS